MTPAPLRAQRVRGIPGVGLRTSDGREWVRDDDGRCYPVNPGICDDCLGSGFDGDGDTCRCMLSVITVRFCGRPSRWGNPYGLVRTPNGFGNNWGVRKGARGNWRCTHVDHAVAVALAVRLFAERIVAKQPYTYFDGLLGYDFLSCFCPLDKPCHVDAIIAEGVARGVWTPNGHHEP